MQNKLICFGLLILMVLAVPVNAYAEHWDRTGFFTNLTRYDYEEAESEVLGYELYIAVGKREGYTGFMLELKEEHSSFQVIEPVFEGDNLIFEFENGKGEKLTFKGIVDQCGLTGNLHLPDGESLRMWRFMRKQSYWN